jgi:hypothetical protein
VTDRVELDPRLAAISRSETLCNEGASGRRDRQGWPESAIRSRAERPARCWRRLRSARSRPMSPGHGGGQNCSLSWLAHWTIHKRWRGRADLRFAGESRCEPGPRSRAPPAALGRSLRTRAGTEGVARDELHESRERDSNPRPPLYECFSGVSLCRSESVDVVSNCLQIRPLAAAGGIVLDTL